MQGLARQVLEEEELRLPLELVQHVRDGEVEQAKQLMWGAAYGDVTDSVWTAVSDVLRGVSTDSLKLISFHLSVEGKDKIRTSQLVFEGPGASGWALVDVSLRSGRAFRFHVQQMGRSLVEANSFWNAPVRLAHIWILLWGASAWIAAIAAAWRVVRTRVKYRIGWAAASFVMVGRVTLNWTTGSVAMNPAAISVPPIGWSTTGVAQPWFVFVGVPLFAILAWRKATRWERDERLCAHAEDTGEADSGS